jgi:uncharacterized protein
VKNILIRATLFLALCAAGLAQQNTPSAITPADTPATAEDVQKYLDAMHSHEMMKQVTEAMVQPMHKMMHEEYLKDKDKLPPDFEERMTKMMDDFMQKMPWDQIMDSMVPVYQKHFTKGDLEALTAFYSSPTGQKVLREMPAVMADSMNTMMPIIQKQVEDMSQQMQKEVEAMRKDTKKESGQARSVTRN